jgi:hypothetical protein
MCGAGAVEAEAYFFHCCNISSARFENFLNGE